jgi:hypothetical protein
VSKRDTQLVRDIVVFLRSYLVLPKDELVIIALWILHTHAFEYVEVTPYIALTSVEERCAKTRVLELVRMLCARPWFEVLPSVAVLYRKIASEEPPPTVLIDETDAMWNPKTADRYEEHRGILNAGYRRGAVVSRVAMGRSNKMEDFQVFAPKIFSGIGMLPSTLADRSIPIRMKRKLPSERVLKYMYRDVMALDSTVDLRARIEAWGASYGAELADRRASLPASLNDRVRETCEVLVVIAEMLGCGIAARGAIVRIHSVERLDSAATKRKKLLRDIRAVFKDIPKDANGHKKIFTEDLLECLHRVDEGGWTDYYGSPLDAEDLSSLLRPYDVKPKSQRIDGEVRKGYSARQLHDAWERYA